MSLSFDGVWKAGVWATTVWAEGVWREGAAPEPPVVDDAVGGYGRQRRRRPQRATRRKLPDGTIIFATQREYDALVATAQETTPQEWQELEAAVEAAPRTEVQRDIFEDAAIRVAELTQPLEAIAPDLAPNETQKELLTFVRLMLSMQDDEDDIEMMLLS